LYRGEACAGTAAFTSTTALAEDDTATSEAFTPTEAGTYAWQATYAGDEGNLATTGTCDAVTVSSTAVVPQPNPPAQPQPVAPAQVGGAPVVLLDVSPVGRRARVSGIARVELAGRQVTILRAGKPVGTAPVGPDGAFSTVVGGPGVGDEAPVMYTVA